MHTPGAFHRICLLLGAALLVLLAAGSCSSSQPQTSNPPVVQTLEITQLVTRDVTVEVTRLVEVLVTVTPSATWQFTPTPSHTPTITPTPELPQASILEYTDCLHGPADFYLYKTSYPAGSRVEVVGRSQDALWINVQEIHGWNACWIPASRAKLDSGDAADLPFVYTALPLTRYDYRPPTTTASRDGDVVTVSWEAVWMSETELRGYLIEAWVCQDGQFIFLPVGVTPTYEENVGVITVEITDEAGCSQPSNARIATATKRGYTLFEKIFWPPH
jgi:hypothetical protein